MGETRRMIGDFFADLVVISARLTRAHMVFQIKVADGSPSEVYDRKEAENQEQLRILRESFPAVNELSRILSLGAVAAQSERLRLLCDDASNHSQLESATFDLLSRLADGLKERRFFFVPYPQATIFELAQPFGEAAEVAFPSTVFDVHESTCPRVPKCSKSRFGRGTRFATSVGRSTI